MDVYNANEMVKHPSHAHDNPFTYAIMGCPPNGIVITLTHSPEFNEREVIAHSMQKYTRCIIVSK
jgi:hypothetical protein